MTAVGLHAELAGLGPRELNGVRELIYAGVPVFVARPALDAQGRWDPRGGTGGTGYWLPENWQHTAADVAVLDSWRPGWAVAAVCGHVLDVLDVDPRNDGEASAAGLKRAGVIPYVYARTATCSGGWHFFIAALGLPKSKPWPGIDYQAGAPDGTGRGFVFLPPTVRASKATGELTAYAWVDEPDGHFIRECAPGDDSGGPLAGLIRSAASHGSGQASSGGGLEVVSTVSPWEDVDAALRQGRQQGIVRLASSLRGYGGWTVDAALFFFRHAVWPRIDQQQAGHPFEWSELEAQVRDVFDRYPDGGVGLPVGSDGYAAAVARKAGELRIVEAARDLLARERAAGGELPVTVPLPDLLAEPDDPVRWSVESVLPADSKALLSAQHKAGKSTTVGNLVRSWVDGSPFLGTFLTTTLGSVAVIDNEMGRARLRRWYRQLGITNSQAVSLLDLRGRASTFNLLDAATRSRWAERLAGHDAVVLDCLRPFLDALGLDENHDAGRFLEAVDELMAEAKVPTYAVVHHMGHAGDHARGDSRLLDWPDVIWNLRRAKPEDPDAQEDDAAVPRFFSAYGRDDVSLPEGRVDYDATTHALTFVPGHTRAGVRVETKRAELRAALILVIGANPGCLAGQLDPLLRERGVRFSKGDEIKEVARMVGDGLVVRQPGVGRATHHFLAPHIPPEPPRD